MEIDRNDFIESVGGADAVARMDHEARADALEEYQSDQLEPAVARAAAKAPAGQTVNEVEALIDTRPYRRGVGKLFIAEQGTVRRLPPMPPRPTLVDFFERRFQSTQHVLQSASLAQRGGASEEVVLACLLHDLGQSLMRTDMAGGARRSSSRTCPSGSPSRSAITRRCAFTPIRRPAMNIRSVRQALRRRLRAAGARRRRIRDGAEAPLVRRRAPRHDAQRLVRVRPDDRGGARPVR